jgi:hypothetical protein
LLASIDRGGKTLYIPLISKMLTLLERPVRGPNGETK